MRHLILPVVAFALAVPSSAQDRFYLPSDTPGQGACSTAPFGSVYSNTIARHQRWQTVITASELGNAPRQITSLAFAACGAGTRSYSRLQVQMNHIQGALSDNFQNNLGGGAVNALDLGNDDWSHDADVWTNIRLNRSFRYDPARGDLILDIRVVNADFQGGDPGFHTALRPCLHIDNYGGAPPHTGNLVASGPKIRIGCGAAFVDRLGTGCGNGPIQLDWTGDARLGTPLAFRMTNAGPGAQPGLAAIWVGFTRIQSGLSSIGAPNCVLRTAPDLSVIVLVQSGISTPMTIPIPNDPVLAGARFYVQGAHVDPGVNALGIEVTGAAVVVAGT